MTRDRPQRANHDHPLHVAVAHLLGVRPDDLTQAAAATAIGVQSSDYSAALHGRIPVTRHALWLMRAGAAVHIDSEGATYWVEKGTPGSLVEALKRPGESNADLGRRLGLSRHVIWRWRWEVGWKTLVREALSRDLSVTCWMQGDAVLMEYHREDTDDAPAAATGDAAGSGDVDTAAA